MVTFAICHYAARRAGSSAIAELLVLRQMSPLDRFTVVVADWPYHSDSYSAAVRVT